MNPIYRKIDIYFPFIAALIGFIYLLIFGLNTSSTTTYVTTAVVLTLFLNTTHIGFSFGAMTSLPEARDWIQLRYGRHNLFLIFVVLITSFFVFTLLFYSNFFSQNPIYDNYLLNTTIIMFSNWHNMAQSMGLSLIYNYKLKQSHQLSPLSLIKLNKITRIERRNVRIVFMLITVMVMNVIPSVSRFTSLTQTQIKIILILVCITLTGQTLYLIHSSALFKNTKKLIFCLRYFIWPFIGTIRIFAYVFQAIHGVEYLLITKKMGEKSCAVNTSQFSFKKSVFLFGVIFFIFGILEVESMGFLLIKNHNFSPHFIAFITYLSTGMFITHGIWDRYFFRLRDEIGLNTVGKLILGEDED